MAEGRDPAGAIIGMNEEEGHRGDGCKLGDAEMHSQRGGILKMALVGHVYVFRSKDEGSGQARVPENRRCQSSNREAVGNDLQIMIVMENDS